jgi:tetratricopeptide (TPR) repeat protein
MGWELFSSAPLWGHGAGSVHVLITQDPSSPPIYLTHTHNILLQAGAEMGLVGVFLLGWSLIQIGRTLILAFRRQGFEERIHIAAIAGSLAATAVHHLVDYALEVPIITVTLLFIVASLCRYSPPDMNYRLTNAGVKKIFALVILIIVAAFYYPTGQFGITKGIREFNSTQSTQSIEAICDQATSHNHISYYQFACGRALAEEGYRSGDRRKLMEAIEHINKGLATDPYWPIHWANLAALEWEIGNEQDALIHMETALASAPDFPIFDINFGWMLEQSGDFDQAYEYYSKAISADPLILDGSIFKQTDFQPDSVSAEQILPTNFEANNDALRGWYYAKLQEWDHAREEFDRAVIINPAHALARSGLALLDLHASSINTSEVHSNIALNSRGSNPMIYFVAGKVSLEQGDVVEAMSLFERAYDLYSSQTYSDRYYKVVYRLDYIAPETVPQLKSVFISEDTFKAFFALAEYKINNQEFDKGQEILRNLQMWMDFGSNEPNQPEFDTLSKSDGLD